MGQKKQMEEITISQNTVSDTQKELLKEVRRIIELVINRYCGKNGLLVEYVDSYTGNILRKRSMMQDFGDYVQYFAWADKVIGQKAWTQWALNQVFTASRLHQTKEGYFTPAVTTDNKQSSQPLFTFLRLEDNQDLLMGILSLYRFTGNEQLLDIARKLFDFIVRRESVTEQLRSNVFFLTHRGKIPIPLRLPCGLIVEELVNFSRIRGDRSYLECAAKIVRKWDSCKYYARLGIFPSVTIPPSLWAPVILPMRMLNIQGINDKMVSSCLIKSNTNMLSGMLEIYRDTKDADIAGRIRRWLNFVRENLMDKRGFFYGMWNDRSKKAYMGRNPLADNHHILNIFLDASVYLKDESFLETARKNINFWLAKRTPLGLMPELKRNYENAILLDTQVDMFINFLKAYNLTKNKEYLEAVVSGTKALRNYFRTDFGLVWCIEGDSGQVLRQNIFTKYLTLFLKLLLLLYQVQEGKDIYQDELLFDMSRDR